MPVKKKGLGKGLDALFIDNATKLEGAAPEPIKLSEIEPNRDQPRKAFDAEALHQLADSIREHGLLQPLLVRPKPEGGYQIVAGERRWRASRMAGLTEVPVIVRDLDDRKTMEIALIENLQREDLNPVEEALGYRALMESYDLTQDEVSHTVGKSRSSVANTLRLLLLPEEILDFVSNGELTAGHARALLGVEDEEVQLALAKEAVARKLSVREMEKAVQRPSVAKERQRTLSPEATFYREMEIAVKDYSNLEIHVKQKQDKGTLSIPFHNREEFVALVEMLTNGGNTAADKPE